MDKKKVYQEKVEAQLKEWGAKIDDLKARAAKSKVELKTKYEKQVQDLRVKQEVVQKKLKEFRESGEEAWEGLKTGIEKSLDDLKGSLDRTMSTYKEKRGETIEAVSKKKKAYIQKMETQLKKWGTDIDLLKAKAEKSKAEAKIMYLKQIKELRAKQNVVKQKLHGFKESGGGAWEEVKAGVDQAVDDLKDAFVRAKSRWKKK
jgi:hypothetical protein